MAQFPRRDIPDELSFEDKILAESVLMLLRTGEVPPYQVYLYYGYTSDTVCRWHVSKFLEPRCHSPYCWTDIIIADSITLWKQHHPCYMKDRLMCGDCPFFHRERHRTNSGGHVMIRYGYCDQLNERRERCDYCHYYDSVWDEDGKPIPYQNAKYKEKGEEDDSDE